MVVTTFNIGANFEFLPASPAHKTTQTVYTKHFTGLLRQGINVVCLQEVHLDWLTKVVMPALGVTWAYKHLGSGTHIAICWDKRIYLSVFADMQENLRVFPKHTSVYKTNRYFIRVALQPLLNPEVLCCVACVHTHDGKGEHKITGDKTAFKMHAGSSSVNQFVSSVRALTDPSSPSAPARGKKVIWALAGDLNLDKGNFRQAMATVRPVAGDFKEYCDPVRKRRDWILMSAPAGQLSESMPVARDDQHTAVACKSVRWDEVESPAPCRIAGTPQDRALGILNNYSDMSEDDAESGFSQQEVSPPPAKKSKSLHFDQDPLLQSFNSLVF